MPPYYQSASTPAFNKTPQIFYCKVKKVKIIIINCNGVKGPSKQAAFHATLDIHKSDIVLGVNQNYVIQCALMNSSLRTTPSFVRIAM